MSISLLTLDRAKDVAEIVAFLRANDLPEAGFAEHTTDVLVARIEGSLVGTAALEIYRSEALLRSVAVARESRGKGVGIDLTRATLERARERGVQTVYLLTESAADFFRRFGFADVDRVAVPDSIRRTVEFASACPASARVMALKLA
jgi:amino-acid N-acetyltransferase